LFPRELAPGAVDQVCLLTGGFSLSLISLNLELCMHGYRLVLDLSQN